MKTVETLSQRMVDWTVGIGPGWWGVVVGTVGMLLSLLALIGPPGAGAGGILEVSFTSPNC